MAEQTDSAWGLLLATRLYEGMRDLEQSDRFVAEAKRQRTSLSR